MTRRTLGVEEELLLVDPATRQVAARSTQVLKRHRERGSGRDPRDASDELDQEFMRHQVETRTDPHRDVGTVLSQLLSARRAAGEAARGAGLAAVAAGITPLPFDLVVSPDDRYRDMVNTYGEMARNAGTCGMHVHVGIDSPEEGVAVIDRVAPWLPVLLALSANSPFAEGRDTRHASWRSQVWSRWPSAGPTEAFGSLAGYREVSASLVATGAARDPGMLYFDARLSEAHPTVEVRVLDVCTDPQDAVLAAALVRALVERAARDHAEGATTPRWRAELLRAAQWRAAHDGLAGMLVHPEHRSPAPARLVLELLVDRVHEELTEAGDADLVAEGVERVLQAGGATRQRAAFERTGSVEGVVDDLVARTEAVWDRPADV